MSRKDTFCDTCPNSYKEESSSFLSKKKNDDFHDVVPLSGWERFFTTTTIEQKNTGEEEGEEKNFVGDTTSSTTRKFIIFSLGHKNVVKGVGDENTPWMDEHAVRIRAGMLHLLAWIAILNAFFLRKPVIAFHVIGLAIWEFSTSLMFGMTPLAPFGTLSTVIAMMLYKEPMWVPARPKRFAWSIGLCMAVSCLICWRIGWAFGFKQKMMMMKDFEEENHNDSSSGSNIMFSIGCSGAFMNDLTGYPVAAAMMLCIRTFVTICLTLTWLEGNCGFCLGCFIYNSIKKNDPENNMNKKSNQQDDSVCEVCVNGDYLTFSEKG